MPWEHDPTAEWMNGAALDISLNYQDQSSQVKSVRIANIALIALVTLFVGARLLVRAFMVRKIFIDDVLILIAAAFTIGLASVCIVATVDIGLGTHVWLLPPSDLILTLKSFIQYLLICQVLFSCAIAATKVAIIASYLRFIQDEKFRWTMYAVSFVICGTWISAVFVSIFQCRPVRAAWDITFIGGRCINYLNYLYASSAINIATDVLLCLLPWPFLWRLHMPKKQRVILCLLFTGGAGACVASLVRISYLHTLYSADVTYECVPSLNLSVIECSLGIICVSIPPLRPLAARLWPGDMHTLGESYDTASIRHRSDVTLVRNLGKSDEYDMSEIDDGKQYEMELRDMEPYHAITTNNTATCIDDISHTTMETALFPSSSESHERKLEDV